jgi:heat shock protein HslJ
MKSISKISQPETESHHISNLMLPLGKKEGSWKAQSHNFAMTMTDLWGLGCNRRN